MFKSIKSTFIKPFEVIFILTLISFFAFFPQLTGIFKTISVSAIYSCPNGGTFNNTNYNCEQIKTGNNCPIGWTDIGGNICSQKPSVSCNYISPQSLERNLSLTDAELRTDQDFSCSDDAKICPVVFSDSDPTDGIKSNSEDLIAGVTVQLVSNDGSQVIYESVTQANVVECFTPVLFNKEYTIKITNPPGGLFNTTGGNQIAAQVTSSQALKTVYFGYSSSAFSLTVPSTVDFGSIGVSPTSETLTTVIPNIKVIDLRAAKPGWSVSARINNFVGQADNNYNIDVANNFENTPLQVDPLDPNVVPGNYKKVISTSDDMTIFSGLTGYGRGTFTIDTESKITVPSYVKAQRYQSIIQYTLI